MTEPPNGILEKYRNALGPKFGDVYYHAHSEWCQLWVTWQQFENLFGHGKERVDLMNKAGASFFFLVDKYFFQSVLMALCRLSDPVKSMGKENLTLMQFHDFMDSEQRKSEMKNLLDNLTKSTEFARDWRNRHIAHNDLGMIFGAAKPLEDATRKGVNSAIADAHKVFAYASMEFMGAGLHNKVFAGLNNEMVMLRRLYCGVQKFEQDLVALRYSHQIPDALPKWLTN